MNSIQHYDTVSPTVHNGEAVRHATATENGQHAETEQRLRKPKEKQPPSPERASSSIDNEKEQEAKKVCVCEYIARSTAADQNRKGYGGEMAKMSNAATITNRNLKARSILLRRLL